MRRTEPFRVRLAQVAPRLGDLKANLALHLQVGEQALADGVDLLIFPELSLTGYYLRDLTSEVTLSLDAPELRELLDLSRRLSMVVGLVEESERCSVFASALYLEAGEIVHVHRKVYLPTYAMFDEGRYFSEGRSVRAFDTRFGRAGILICEDIWHPVLPYLLAQDGAQMLIVTANSPVRGAKAGGLSIARSYEQMLATYANLLQCYVLFCNRVGCEDGVSFWGGSLVLSPDGEVAARAEFMEAATVDAQVAPLQVRHARIAAPLVEEENLDLALRELRRVADERSGP